jgi:hypothetical protein
MSCVRPLRPLLPEDPEAVEVQRVLQAVLRQGWNDLRGQPPWFGQMACGAVDAGQLQEWHQFLRSCA